MDIRDLQSALRLFAAERDWTQFHSPKNLSMALSVEAAELLEQFQWLSEEQSRNLSNESKMRVQQEIADVLLYLLQLCDSLNIEPLEAARLKMEENAAKYPVALAKGRSTKYTEL